jgi:peptide-methionine (S)-S-oxide reductase
MLARLNQLRIGLALPFISYTTRVDPNSFRSNMSTGMGPSHRLLIDLTPSYFNWAATAKPEVATFASGCFWGVEHIFLKHYPPSQNKGILKTSVGYTGGAVPNPSYRAVCSADTGHAEALRIEFDPSVVAYKELVGGWLFPRSNNGVMIANVELFYRILLPHARPDCP